MNFFKDKTYIIAGASSGIGKNVAEYLTNEMHANVVLIARRYEMISKLAKELPGNNYAIEYDFCDVENIENIFTELCKKNIAIDGMVYAVGIAPLFKIEDNDYDLMMRTMKVNSLAFGEAGKHMLRAECVNDNASIVAISSIVSLTTTNRQSAYAASKAMLNTYVKYLAKEALGRMRVNAVLPGTVETEMFEKLKLESPDLEKKMKINYPLGVIPKEEISKLVVFLLSDNAKHITGSLFPIDSGYMLK